MYRAKTVVFLWLAVCIASVHAADLGAELYQAVGAGELDKARQLIDAGADVDAPQPPYALSPIHIAPGQGLDMVKLLVEGGAEIDLKDGDGATALLSAVLLGKTRVVAFLLEKGASVELVTKDGLTPLTQAAFNGSDDIVRLLLQSGADVNKARGDGYTAGRGHGTGLHGRNSSEGRRRVNFPTDRSTAYSTAHSGNCPHCSQPGQPLQL